MAIDTMEALDLRAVASIPTPIADSLLSRGCRSWGDVIKVPEATKAALTSCRVPEEASDALAQKLLLAGEQELRASNIAGRAPAAATDGHGQSTWRGADSALAILRRGQDLPPLSLPCRGLCGLLGSALRPGGAILEVCGLPGSGKTQLSMQLCAAAQLAPLTRASASAASASPQQAPVAEAIYVDAEGSFVPRRYAQICRGLLLERFGEASEAIIDLTLQRMHVCRTYDATELFTTIKQLGPFLKRHPNVKIIIVDSLAFSFRHEFSENTTQRARLLMDIASTLRSYGAAHRLHLVVTNHMTTRFAGSFGALNNGSNNNNNGGNNMGAGWLTPALGESWAHQPSTQLRLERLPEHQQHQHQQQQLQQQQQQLQRGALHIGVFCRAILTKSVERGVGETCIFTITENGVRDVLSA